MKRRGKKKMKDYKKKKRRKDRRLEHFKKKISRKSLPSPSSFHNYSLALSFAYLRLACSGRTLAQPHVPFALSLSLLASSLRSVCSPFPLFGSGSIRRAGDGAKFGVFAPSALPADGAAPFVQESSVVKPKRKNRGTDRVQGPALCYAATAASPSPWSRWFLFAFHHF